MAENGNIYAVLTGDLVKSSRLTSTQSTQTMYLLKTSVSLFEAAFPGSVYGNMDTFRHDSWQLLMNTPLHALRAALFLRSALKMESDATAKYDTRISIGIGTVEYIAEERISDSRGPSFTLSGKGVDTMKGSCLALGIPTEKADLWNDMIHAVIPLLDCIATDWTPTESRAVNAALLGRTQEETAARWTAKSAEAPTRQAVGNSLIRAHWNTVHAVLLWSEKKIIETLYNR